MRITSMKGQKCPYTKGQPILCQEGYCQDCKIYLAREDELPTIDQFVGSDPNYTGDMTTEEYIRDMRGTSKK